MKFLQLVTLFICIVLRSNVKAFLKDLFSSNSDPYTVYCKDDNDCIRDIDPPCYCIHMQLICGCQQYAVGTIHQDIKKPSNNLDTARQLDTTETNVEAKLPKKMKKLMKHIEEDMIRIKEK